jgi:hypothetical protein
MVGGSAKAGVVKARNCTAKTAAVKPILKYFGFCFHIYFPRKSKGL